MEIVQLHAAAAQMALPQLSAIFRACVEDGASIGYLLPFTDEDAAHYWREVFAHVDDDVLLFVARDGETILGTVQLGLESRPNGSHRAEVRKLLVPPSGRGRGVATQLMQAIEDVARRQGRSLLVLDTRVGDVAERIYRRLGYQVTGIVPQYARSTEGVLEDCVFMYKLLEDPHP